MGELAQSIAGFFAENVSKEFAVFIISMLPIIELRGSIPVGTVLGVAPLWNYVMAVIGNMLPIPFILLFIKKIFELLKRTRVFKPVVTKLENKALSKSDQIQKYGTWGLFLFVAIPLPGTGAWTGALAATLLQLPPKKAFPFILLGVMTAGVIMLFGSEAVKLIVNLFR